MSRCVMPALILVSAMGCQASGSSAGERAVRQRAAEAVADETEPSPVMSWAHDIRATALAVNLDTRRASASIELQPAAGQTSASFEVGDLEILGVRGPAGPLAHAESGARLDLVLPAGDGPLTVEIDYRFAWHEDQHGAMSAGSSLLWPDHCGNLFPCKSDPADGVRLSLELSGVAPGLQAIYPASLPSDAPSYQLAWAVGAYERLDLGHTQAGTEVSVWYLPSSRAAAQSGTTTLRAAFDWLEQTYGAYAFGAHVGSVEAPGLGRFSGMEHHPYWHLRPEAMALAEVHVHEAAHGWFGAGVRLACWEDLVLSEGTVTYLTTRAIEVADSTAAADALWAEHREQLLRPRSQLRPVWPEGCGSADVLALYDDLVYVKGAFFYRALERRIGREQLDAALADAYTRKRGKASGMQDILDVIEARTGYDPNACARAWLREVELPADIDAACPTDAREHEDSASHPR